MSSHTHTCEIPLTYTGTVSSRLPCHDTNNSSSPAGGVSPSRKDAMQQWRTGLPCPVLVFPVLHQGAGQMRAKEEIKQLYLVLPLFLPQAATMQHWWEALARAHPQVPSKEDQNTSWGTGNTFCASMMLMEVQGNTSISEHGLVQKSRFVTGPQSLSCGVEAGAPGRDWWGWPCSSTSCSSFAVYVT